MSRAVAEHEGPSIWSWETYAKIRRHLRLKLSKGITPLTEELIEFYTTPEAADRVPSYLDVQLWVKERVERRFECPAGHPVVPYELRATMNRRRLMLRTFPNADGNPTRYIPIRFWLCLTCQSVFRQREVVLVADHHRPPAPITMEYVEGFKGSD